MNSVPIGKVLLTVLMVIITVSNFSSVNSTTSQPNGTLTVSKQIDMRQEGVPILSPSQFNIEVTFSTGTQSEPGSNEGQSYTAPGNTTYTVVEDTNQIPGVSYRQVFIGDCGQDGVDTIDVGNPKECTVRNFIISVEAGGVTEEGTQSQIAPGPQSTEEFSFQSRQDDTSEETILISPYYFVIIIAIALITPVIIDQVLSYYRAITKNKAEKPAPMSGLYRALMTFGVILLVSAVVFYILGILTSSVVQSLPRAIDSMADLIRTINASDLPDAAAEQMVQTTTRNTDALLDFNSSMLEIIKNIAIVLGGAVSAIIGFYFGNKAAMEYGDRVMTEAEELLEGGKKRGRKNGRDEGHDSDTSVEEPGEDDDGDADIIMRPLTDDRESVGNSKDESTKDNVK